MMQWKTAQAKYLLDLAKLCDEWSQQAKGLDRLPDLNQWLQSRTEEDRKALELETDWLYIPKNCWDWGWERSRFKKVGGEAPMLELLAEYYAAQEPAPTLEQVMTDLQDWHKKVSFCLAGQLMGEEAGENSPAPVTPEQLGEKLALQAAPKKRRGESGNLLGKYVNRHFKSLSAGQYGGAELSKWGNQTSFALIAATKLAERRGSGAAEGGKNRFSLPGQVKDAPKLALVWRLLSEKTEGWTQITQDGYGWYKGKNPGKDLHDLLERYGEPVDFQTDKDSRLDYRVYQGDRHFADLTAAQWRSESAAGQGFLPSLDVPGTKPYACLDRLVKNCGENANEVQKILELLPELIKEKERERQRVMIRKVREEQRAVLEMALWERYPHRNRKQSERKKVENGTPEKWLVTVLKKDIGQKKKSEVDLHKWELVEPVDEKHVNPDAHFQCALFSLFCDPDTAMMQDWSVEKKSETVFVLENHGPLIYTEGYGFKGVKTLDYFAGAYDENSNDLKIRKEKVLWLNRLAFGIYRENRGKAEMEPRNWEDVVRAYLPGENGETAAEFTKALFDANATEPVDDQEYKSLFPALKTELIARQNQSFVLEEGKDGFLYWKEESSV